MAKQESECFFQIFKKAILLYYDNYMTNENVVRTY